MPLAAATTVMAANVDKADAAQPENVNMPNNTITTGINQEMAANPVNLNTNTVYAQDLQKQANKRSDIENLARAVNYANQVSRGVHSVEDLYGAVTNFGNSTNIDSVLYNTQNVLYRASEGEKVLSPILSKPGVKTDVTQNQTATVTQTQKVENNKNVAQPKVSNKKAKVQNSNTKVTTQDTNKKVETKDTNKKVKTQDSNKKYENTQATKKVEKTSVSHNLNIDKAYFDNIKYNPIDREDILSNKILKIDVAAGTINAQLRTMRTEGNDGTKDYAELLAKYNSLRAESDKLRAERIKLTEQRRNEGINSTIEKDSAEYKSRTITAEKFEDLTAFRKLPSNITAGEKIAILSDGLTDIKLAIDGCKKNGDSHTAGELVKIYNEVLVQRYELAKEAHEHPNDPAYNLSYPKYDVKKTTVKQTSDKKSSNKININDVAKNENFSSSLEQFVKDNKKKEVSINESYKKLEMNKKASNKININDIAKNENFSSSLEQFVKDNKKKEVSINESYKKLETDKKAPDKVNINDVAKNENFSSSLEQFVQNDEKKNVSINESYKKLDTDKKKSDKININDVGKNENFSSSLQQYVSDQKRTDEPQKIELDDKALNNISIGQMGTLDHMSTSLEEYVKEQEKKEKSSEYKKLDIDNHKANKDKIKDDGEER